MNKNFIKSLIVVGMMFLITSCAATGGRGQLGTMKRSLNHKSYGYQIVDDHTGSAPSESIERFEVRDGDCSSNSDWSDCRTDRERSELTQGGRGHATSSGEYWYGWSIYIPENEFQSIYPAKSIHGQFHTSGGGAKKPAWTFQISQNEYILKDEINGYHHSLAWLEDMVGKWTQIEIHVKWSSRDNGFMRVYVNGKQIDLDHENMATHRGPGIYFKYGIYRSYLSRYKYQDDAIYDTVPTQVIYFDNVKQSRTREGIQAVQ